MEVAEGWFLCHFVDILNWIETETMSGGKILKLHGGVQDRRT